MITLPTIWECGANVIWKKRLWCTTAVNVPLRQITRYDLNIASGIIHSAKENEITKHYHRVAPQGKHHGFIFRCTCRTPAEKVELWAYYFQISWYRFTRLNGLSLPSHRKQNMNPAFPVGWNISAGWEARSVAGYISLQMKRQPPTCKHW